MATRIPEKEIKKQNRDGHRVTLSPQQYEAVIFDMDGVVTQTAKVHAAAWKTLFDDFLKNDAESRHQAFKPFDIEHDYLKYVDGKKREDGLTSFLESRGIHLPMGSPDDPAGKNTVYGLSKRKDELFLRHLHEEGVHVYDSTVSLIKTLRENHIRTAIISASRNCEEVLKTAQVLDLFDTRVDGVVAAKLGLPGKPAPDVFLEAAKRLGVSPEKAVVVEDALAGVEAGHTGHFGLVIGVNRAHHADDLKRQGADVVVSDLSQVCLSRNEDSSVHHSNLQSPSAEIDEWVLTYDHYVPKEEGRRETLCALGNGYFVTRAAAFASRDDGVHYPGTYLAGGYNRLKSKVHDQTLENEDLVNFPNWLLLRFKIDDGDWFSLDQVEILSYRQHLNLREGVLYREVHFQDRDQRETKITERRFVHMEYYHYAGLEVTITPIGWSGKLTLHSALDGTVINNNVKRFRFLNKKHLEPLENRVLNDESVLLKVRTNQSDIRMAQAARTRIFLNDELLKPDRRDIVDSGYIAQEFYLDVGSEASIRVEKILALYTSRDNAISECGQEAIRSIELALNFQDLFESQVKTWWHLWERFDMRMHAGELKTKAKTLLVLRLHVFHILQSLSVNSMDLDIGVPARGWHGEAYRGHIFWDDMLVFRFLNLRMPDLTASLLKYRYRRLPEARRLARAAGYRGAMYPWQSGSDGQEETPAAYLNPYSSSNGWIEDNTYLQRHVSSAIAYNIWQYYQVTGDIDFMFSYGAEMILEIARFWASVATYNKALDRYEITGVVGPDEYHDRFPADSPGPGLKNNTYTNLMAVWVLCRAPEILDMLPDDYRKALVDKLALSDQEIQRWDDISRKMRILYLDEGECILSQFEGFETLAELDWDGYRKKYGDIQRIDEILHAEGDTPNRYQVIKQADVLMLFYLFSYDELSQLFQRLNYPFPRSAMVKNIHYYQKRTSHGSTLSRVVYSWVLARSDRPRSLDLFIEAFESDLNDIQGGTTPEGIHLGAMAGTLDIVQRCYTGLILKEDILWFNPSLPDKINGIEFITHYRFHCLNINLNHEKLTVTALPSVAQCINIGFDGQTHALEAGQKLEFQLKKKR